MPSRNATWQLNIHQNRGLNKKTSAIHSLPRVITGTGNFIQLKWRRTYGGFVRSLGQKQLWFPALTPDFPKTASMLIKWFTVKTQIRFTLSKSSDFFRFSKFRGKIFDDHPNNSKQCLANLLGSGVQNRLFCLFASASRKRSANAEVNSPGKMENGWPLFPFVAHKSSKNAGCWVAGSARVVITQDSWKKKSLSISSEHCRGISKIPCGNSLSILNR